MAAPAILAIATLVFLWSWVDSGMWVNLVSALGTAALVPAGYFSPVVWRGSLKANADAMLTVRPPAWSSRLAGVGCVLVVLGALIRFV